MLFMHATCIHPKCLMRFDAMRRFVGVLCALLIHGGPILRAYLVVLLGLNVLAVVVHLAQLAQLLMCGLVPECTLAGAEPLNGGDFEGLVGLLEEFLALPGH